MMTRFRKRWSPRSGRSPLAASARHGFTLTELMVVIAIISFLAMAVVTSMYGAAESAKRMRTQQMIGKIDAQLMPRWESYMTRRLPLNAPTTSQSATTTKLKQVYAQYKLWGMRELLRMDFPDRYIDLTFSPVFLFTQSSSGGQNMPYYSDLSRLYSRIITQCTGGTLSKGLTTLGQKHQSAECLYMIITGSAQDTDLASNSFGPTEVGDNDNDGMFEFLDAWGNSIEFLRWAPGFNSDMQPVFSISPGDPAASQYPKNLQKDPNNPNNFLSHFPVSYNPYMPVNLSSSSSSSSGSNPYFFAVVDYHDAFDPLEVDPGAGNFPSPERGYNLIPLIVSAGPDGMSGQLNYTSNTNADTVDSSFGLHWGIPAANPATSSVYINTDDDPYTQYSSPDGTGQTQRGALDVTTAAASYDNIHNHFLRTRP